MSKKLDTLPFFALEASDGSDKAHLKQVPAPSQNLTEAEKYWSRCLEIIRDNVSPHVFATWFEPIKAQSFASSQLVVNVPSQFFCEWIEEHYYPLLQRTIVEVLGENCVLKYNIMVDVAAEKAENRTIKLPAFKNPPSAKQTALSFDSKPQEIEYQSGLNPRYSFENFICGEGNQLANSAAKAVADRPGGTRYNPLVIYGSSGLGKTHLVQAIGNEVLRKRKNAKVLYTTSEHFTMEFLNALQKHKGNEFNAYYRAFDVLIVDDIQFFSGKTGIQNCFFHTFNAFHQAGKQIILTSDRPPKDIQDVDERLISRFQWGLTVDIQPPDYETRIAILMKKSSDEGIEIPFEVAEYIAENVTASVRELEGALIGLIAKVTLDRKQLTLDLAREVVSGISSAPAPVKEINIDVIKGVVSAFYNVSAEMMESKSRKHEITLARQMSMYLTKEMTRSSLKVIGANFGGRDHSTVLHSCQAIENYLVTDRVVKNAYNQMKQELLSMKGN